MNETVGAIGEDSSEWEPPFNKGFALSTRDGSQLDGDPSGLFLETEEP